MSARTVTECALCGEDGLEPVLSLGSSPATCSMVPVGVRVATEEHHPLELLRCAGCSLVQLSVVVDPVDVFPPDYPYSSGNSRALHDDFEDLAAEAQRSVALGADSLVVDIGANDGTLLSKFDGCRTVGVEPTGQAERIAGPAYREFFDEHTAIRIVAEHGQANVVTACNVLAHVEDIGTVMRGIGLLLADDGVLVAENHDLASVVGGQWDTVYHEHLRFYSPASFAALLARHGLGVRGWHPVATHGGSFRTIAAKGLGNGAVSQQAHDFRALARTVSSVRREIRKATAGGVWGIGATARATTIINYCGLDVDDVECVCEVAGSDKIGRYIPGTRIPVIDEQRLFDEQPERAVLFSWHLADVIVPKLRERGYRGELIVPLPVLRSV